MAEPAREMTVALTARVTSACPNLQLRLPVGTSLKLQQPWRGLRHRGPLGGHDERKVQRRRTLSGGAPNVTPQLCSPTRAAALLVKTPGFEHGRADVSAGSKSADVRSAGRLIVDRRPHALEIDRFHSHSV